MPDDLELATLEEAARAVGKTPHNIRDYLQRGRIAKQGDDPYHETNFFMMKES